MTDHIVSIRPFAQTRHSYLMKCVGSSADPALASQKVIGSMGILVLRWWPFGDHKWVYCLYKMVVTLWLKPHWWRGWLNMVVTRYFNRPGWLRHLEHPHITWSLESSFSQACPANGWHKCRDKSSESNLVVMMVIDDDDDDYYYYFDDDEHYVDAPFGIYL